MAKDDKGKVRMTVIHFETESSNETLQENIRQIANTISRSLGLPPPARTPLPPVQLQPSNPLEQAYEVDSIADDAGQSSPSTPQRPRTGKKRLTVTPAKVLDDLNLNGGNIPLNTFIEQNKPESHTKRYLVIAAWLKEYRNIDEITGDHIYTCL